MHEALITRGHVHKAPHDIRDLVFHPCNVVFRHSYCPPIHTDDYGVVTFRHGGGTGGPLTVERCAIALIGHEGYDREVEYLEAMAQVFPQVGREALNRFCDVVEKVKRDGN